MGISMTRKASLLASAAVPPLLIPEPPPVDDWFGAADVNYHYIDGTDYELIVA
jgi:hypothetical protein